MSELDCEGRDELHYAAKNDDVDAVRRRLEAGVPVDLAERRARWTPLFFAVDNGAVAAAEALLDAGAGVEARADREIAPLHLAVNRWRQSPDGAMIKLLLGRGADRTSADMHGWTPGDRGKGQFGFPDDLKELLGL